MKNTNIAACVFFPLRACLKSPAPCRVRARGLQLTGGFAIGCRPGVLTGRIFRQALITGILSAADNWKEKLQKESRIILP